MIIHGLQNESIKPEKDIVEEIYPKLLANYDLTIDANSYVYQGIFESLVELQKTGWKLGVCTNKPELQANNLLEKMKIRNFFDSFIGSDTVGFAKPNPKPLLTAINRLGVPVENAVLVGDTKTDSDTAKAANVKLLLVRYGHGSIVQDIELLLPDALVDHPKEIPQALSYLCRS